MKVHRITLLVSVLSLFPFFVADVHAHILADLWNKYADMVQEKKADLALGRTIGTIREPDRAAMTYPWKYRSRTYEFHCEKPNELAAMVYGLALFAHDVSPSLPKETFLAGVLGFHYSVSQICAWLNDVARTRASLTPQESGFVGILLQDGVIGIVEGFWSKTGSVTHVLGAAPGKKRAFAKNLHHERLHVFWDEDATFRMRERNLWDNLKPAEREKEKARLGKYDQKNEAQLIEEWAVKRAETSNMPLE